MRILKPIFELVKETIDGWTMVNGNLMAAALAYYATFSLAPLLVITISLAGMIFGEANVTNALLVQISAFMGPEIAESVENIINSIQRNPATDITAIISVVIMVIGASILFVQLKRAINFLWGISPIPGQGFIITVRSHLLSLAWVLLMGMLLVAVMGIGTMLIFMDQSLTITVLPT